MTARLGTRARPARIGIIGAGPAGFYTAEALLKSPHFVCTIDFFNHLPTPYGLVRDGVAPDHQPIKSIIRVYDKIARHPRVRYFGNVTFGRHLRHEELKPLYDQLVYAVGAQADRRMGIPGEELVGSAPATLFVGWYNGHPDCGHVRFDLSHERVGVVGNGNVALDVTRLLVTNPEELARTDIADKALASLRDSQVREVVLLGRRGPAQAAFGNAELRQLGALQGVEVRVDAADLVLDTQSQETLASDRVVARNLELLRGFAERPRTGAPRRVLMRFLSSPVEVLGTGGRVRGLRVERNRLITDENGAQRARGTGAFETLEVGLVLRAVGYRGVPLPGVPFDDMSHTIPNVGGRVIHAVTGEPIPGEYVVGWIKRGPSGVIGTNKLDAASTVAAMLEDLPTLTGIADENRDPTRIQALLAARKPDYVTYEDWKVLDAYEVARGVAQGRPRVKVTSVPEMLEIIRQHPPPAPDHGRPLR